MTQHFSTSTQKAHSPSTQTACPPSGLAIAPMDITGHVLFLEGNAMKTSIAWNSFIKEAMPDAEQRAELQAFTGAAWAAPIPHESVNHAG